jgi:hypothetical protein
VLQPLPKLQRIRRPPLHTSKGCGLPSYLQPRSVDIIASACSRQPLMLAPHPPRVQLI